MSKQILFSEEANDTAHGGVTAIGKLIQEIAETGLDASKGVFAVEPSVFSGKKKITWRLK